MPSSQLCQCALDIGRQCLEAGTVRFWPRANDDIGHQTSRQHTEPSKLTQASLELISRNSSLLELRNDETNPHTAYRTHKRGGSSPDLEMSSPNAPPLSRDALKLRTPRDP